jgi:hypothetical protein
MVDYDIWVAKNATWNPVGTPVLLKSAMQVSDE